MAPQPIRQFKGEYAWLSNFYRHAIVYRGIVYPTNEHLYQALKNTSRTYRREVSELATPHEAKRMGNTVKLRDDWNEVREPAMALCLRLKYADVEMAARLMRTHPAMLVEGNTWGDRYWGVCKGKGLNRLGILTMEHREHLWARLFRG